MCLAVSENVPGLRVWLRNELLRWSDIYQDNLREIDITARIPAELSSSVQPVKGASRLLIQITTLAFSSDEKHNLVDVLGRLYAATAALVYEFEANLPPPPPTPTNLVATAGDNQVSLSWTASTGATRYDVYRGTTSASETVLPSSTIIAGTSFTDITAVNGTQYFYSVSALNGSASSGKSNHVSATPLAPAPVSQVLSLRRFPLAPTLQWHGNEHVERYPQPP
jgi:hypothetical protein